VGYVNLLEFGKALPGANIPEGMEQRRGAKCTVLKKVFRKLLSFLNLNYS
jgi:hypothetical protein